MARDTPNSLVVSSDLSELARVAAWVRAWTQWHHVPSRTAELVDLCSAEVVTNIMMHAYTGCGTHQISLRLDSHPDVLALEIQDDGRPFDPRQVAEPHPATSLEDAKINGRGIQIFRHFSDELRYRRADGRNYLTLIFQVPHSCHHDETEQTAGQTEK
jgi:anti-sigma regulatory factor (Ser/Thr protein kinase)